MMDALQAVGECPRCRALEARVHILEEQVRLLTAALEEAHRAGKRQAAPFRKPKRRGKPKKPGRKPGDQYGEHARRTAPTPEQISEQYEVPLPDSCENCHSGDIKPGHTVVQYQVEIPQQPIYRQFTIAIGRCRHCGKAIQGRHALQTSDAIGAAGVQLGPRAHAAMAWMHYRQAACVTHVSSVWSGNDWPPRWGNPG